MVTMVILQFKAIDEEAAEISRTTKHSVQRQKVNVHGVENRRQRNRKRT